MPMHCAVHGCFNGGLRLRKWKEDFVKFIFVKGPPKIATVGHCSSK